MSGSLRRLEKRKKRRRTRQNKRRAEMKVASLTPGTHIRRLWLLPSGPDQVHHPAMRGDPPRRMLSHQPPPRRKWRWKSSMKAACCSALAPENSIATSRRGNCRMPTCRAGRDGSGCRRCARPVADANSRRRLLHQPAGQQRLQLALELGQRQVIANCGTSGQAAGDRRPDGQHIAGDQRALGTRLRGNELAIDQDQMHQTRRQRPGGDQRSDGGLSGTSRATALLRRASGADNRKERRTA
jgi:hypothetical protein